MSELILKLKSEKLNSIIGVTGVIKKKPPSNCIWTFNSHFEQFITTQPGMTDLLNHICQSLTYNDSKSVKNVTKEFQTWISNSKIFKLAYEADLVIAKVITTIKDSCFREHFVKVLNNVYKSIIGDCDADLVKFAKIELDSSLNEDYMKKAFKIVTICQEIKEEVNDV